MHFQMQLMTKQKTQKKPLIVDCSYDGAMWYMNKYLPSLPPLERNNHFVLVQTNAHKALNRAYYRQFSEKRFMKQDYAIPVHSKEKEANAIKSIFKQMQNGDKFDIYDNNDEITKQPKKIFAATKTQDAINIDILDIRKLAKNFHFKSHVSDGKKAKKISSNKGIYEGSGEYKRFNFDKEVKYIKDLLPTDAKITLHQYNPKDKKELTNQRLNIGNTKCVEHVSHAHQTFFVPAKKVRGMLGIRSVAHQR